ncbi:hypothetical protein C0995_012950 [Termitomyces sp. Mi166|nr:hypothetical protein C0995_012950 [Termitomyces sp. Mi166\
MAWDDPLGSLIWGGLVSKLARPSLIDWDPSKWLILILYQLGLVFGLRRAKDSDLKEAINYMQLKTHFRGPIQENDLNYWTGDVWNETQLLEYIQAVPGRCVIEIDGFAIDATEYLREHPGGATLLRKYSTSPSSRTNLDASECTTQAASPTQWTYNSDFRQDTRMSKRELEQLNGATEMEGPRTKRRRETAAVSTDVEATHSDPITEGGDENVDSGVKKDVYELGLKLYETVRDAVNKEGRTLSLVFQRRPSKRQYPDYYQIIQHPIALEDIKKQLDNGSYKTLEAVKQDFELCFNNAKQYNIKESDIYRDAKDLSKLMNKTYNKLVPQADGGVTGDGEGKRSKPPNLTRLIKSRLQKLIDKTDDSYDLIFSRPIDILIRDVFLVRGRLLSLEFMELPSKKDWPSYYKLIKRPQCFENIFKRIKRKEYTTSSDFAADVELVFDNAMTFNQEYTGIWEDAKTLRDYFRILVADLPPPFEIPQYAAAKPKIKIKPQPSQPSASSAVPATAQPSTSSTSTPQTLRIPPVKHVKMSPVSTPVTPAVSLPAATSTPPPQVTTTAPVTQITRPPATSAPVPYLSTTFSHYPNASYVPPVPAPAAPIASTSTSNLPTNPVVLAHSASNSPAPPLHPSHQLKSVSLVVQPRGRTLNLDFEDGVKCWALRLLSGETEIHVSQVTFMGDEDESSGEEEEEEEEEEDMEGAINGRKRGRTRGRGRPKSANKAKGKTAQVKKKKQKIGPVQVKLNGVVAKEQEDESGQWSVSPTVGTSTIEIGESGGLIWKNPSEFRHHDWRRSRNAQGGREGSNSRSISGVWGAHKSSASASSPIDHGWGVPHRQTKEQSDKSGWGSSKGSVDQPASLPTASAFPDNVWGSSNNSNDTGKDLDTQNRWGSTNNGWGTDAGGGKGGKGEASASKDSTSGWGASSSISGRWGSLGPVTGDKRWGSSSDNGNRGSASKDERDKVSTAGSEWSATTKDSSTNKTNIGNQAWNTSSGWNTSANDWDTRAKPPDPRRPPPPIPRPTEIHEEGSRSLTPQPAMSPMTAPPPLRLPLPGRKSSSSTFALSPTTDKETSNVRTSLKVKTKGLDPSESVASGVPNSARPRETPLTRSRIQLNMIKYTLQAVRLQLELDEARANVERWKRLRSSTQFNRATPLTQNIINDQRLAYGQNEKELETQLHATIRYLADLPELTTRAELVSAKADGQDLVEYTAQLRDWIEGLEALYRASFSPETDSPASSTATERPKHPNEIVWDRIETLVQSVDDNISFIEDTLYANKDIRADIVSRTAALRDDHNAKQSEAKGKAEMSLKEAKEVGSDLEVLLADYLQQLEQWKQEDTALIERLTQQIKSLHTKKRPTRVPFDQEELKERMKEYTLHKMTEQVYSLLHTIQEAAKNNSKTFVSEILKQLDPILEVTNEVCRRAEAITSRFPTPS